MLLGLSGALAAAFCYGLASVLQALAARGDTRSPGTDPPPLLRLLRAWPYLSGLTLDALGFLLSLAALRTLPLFLVQAVVASSLGVTAVVGSRVLGLRLTRTDRVGLVGVVGGLALLGLSASSEVAVRHDGSQGWVALAVAVLLVPAALAAARLAGPLAACALGSVAGLAFGAVAYAARVLVWPVGPVGPVGPGGPGGSDGPVGSGGSGGPGDVARTLLGEPAAYAILLGAAVAMVGYAAALRHGDVLAATACLVVTETVAPALAGLVLLGDRARAGWAVVAVTGFVLAVAGAVGLARHGQLIDAGRGQEIDRLDDRHSGRGHTIEQERPDVTGGEGSWR